MSRDDLARLLRFLVEGERVADVVVVSFSVLSTHATESGGTDSLDLFERQILREAISVIRVSGTEPRESS